MKKLIRITININREALVETSLKPDAFYSVKIKEGITEQLGEDWEEWYNCKTVSKDLFEDVLDCLVEVVPIPELEEMEQRWEYGV